MKTTILCLTTGLALSGCTKLEPADKSVPITGLSLNETAKTLTEGETFVLTATVAPDNATNKTLAWTSSNAEIASVIDGTVTAVAAGETVISVGVKDGGKTASCTVTVTKSLVPVAGVSLNTALAIMTPGKTFVLTPKVTPDNATNKTLAWTSSNPGIVSVTDGTLTAVALGEARITVVSEDGGKTASCTVRVVSGITMTTRADDILIALTGSGTATVDWGDGTRDTYQLHDDYRDGITHAYAASSGDHTVTIIGKDITGLNCNNNQLTDLDVSESATLTALVCRYNPLTVLDLSENTALMYLDCESTRLTALNVSKNTELLTLYCENNQLTALDLSENKALGWLWCPGNRLSAEALNALFGTLHDNTILDRPKTICFDNNPGAAGCDKTIAELREWTVYSELTKRGKFEDQGKFPRPNGKGQ